MNLRLRHGRTRGGYWCCLLTLCVGAGCATATPPTLLPRISQPPAPRVGGIYHRVERGHTLWRIAQQYHVSLETLVSANQLEAPQRIAKGQLLWIPGATTPQRIEMARPSGRDGDDNFQWPVRGEIISYFGARQGGSTNRGIDVRVGRGAPVRAARGGRVVFIDTGMSGYGKTVIVDHGDGFSTVYAWNGELLVQLGQVVSRATPIATAGASGRAPSLALHFEVRRHHAPQNPLYFLPSR